MKLFFDKQTNTLSASAGGRALTQLPLPLGLHDVVLITLDGGRPWSIPATERVIQLGLADADGELLALCETWTQNTVTRHWTGTLNLSTQELLDAVANNAVVSTQLAISHDNLTPYRSQKVATTVSLPAFDEVGELTSLPPAPDDEYFNYTIAQTLTSLQKTQKRADLGLVIGTDVQAYDADLAAIAALTTTAYGRAFLALANAAAAQTAAGLSSADSVTFADVTAAAFKRNSSHFLSVTGSRALATTDSGKTLVVTGASNVTLTVDTNFGVSGCEIVNALTAPAVLTVATSGTTINGGTDSIQPNRRTAMELNYNGSANTFSLTSRASSGAMPRIAEKQVNTTRTSTITRTDDPELLMTLEPGNYQIELIMQYYCESGTPGITSELKFSTPAFNYNYQLVRGATGAAGVTNSYPDTAGSASTFFGLDQLDQAGWLRLWGTFDVATTGVLSVQWAQKVSSADDTTLGRGSYLKVQKIIF